MMEPTTIVRWVEMLGMQPLGLWTGFVGAVLSLFVVNGNSLTWRRSFLILWSGMILASYAYSIVARSFGEWTALICLGIGFLAADFLGSIKSAAPTLTNALVQKLSKMAGLHTEKDNKKNE